jgi:hypothetical protein
VITIDLVTFAIAVATMLVLRTPQPAQTDEGRKMGGSFWKEIISGWRFLWSLRVLFIYRMYVALAEMTLALMIPLNYPYLLSRTGSETTLGVLLSLASAGAIAGSFLLNVWGGFRPRIHTLMIGMMLNSLLIAITGIARTPVMLGLCVFFRSMPRSIFEATDASLMQVKIPPDLQGRVFTAKHQLTLLTFGLMFLIGGLLTDSVIAPGVSRPGWSSIAPLVGDGVAGGMGLVHVVVGLTAFLMSAGIYALPAIRRMESALPDYEPAAAQE